MAPNTVLAPIWPDADAPICVGGQVVELRPADSNPRQWGDNLDGEGEPAGNWAQMEQLGRQQNGRPDKMADNNRLLQPMGQRGLSSTGEKTTSRPNNNMTNDNRNNNNNNELAGQKQALRVELATDKLALGAHLDFRCQWAAEPAERMEYSWYLNNSFGERRLLAADTSSSGGQERPEVAGATPDSLGRRLHFELGGRATVAAGSPSSSRRTSQLSFRLESGADFGQLYCLARNELGEQKRACVYNLRPGGRYRARCTVYSYPLGFRCFGPLAPKFGQWRHR